ncbi:MAG: sulfatase-like hydrolase/transferase, partial [Armatimonadetes bacterium]|nr:sulfatase-like hydrolase/transferase [Armatimonadota bacterium]
MATKRPNIVLFGIDSIRADHMSCYGYPRLTTPHIDELAEE